MEKRYITMLKDSLRKKQEILGRIMSENETQREIFENSDSAPGELEKTMERKSVLIDKLDELDDGFEEFFKRVESEIEGHKDELKDDIAELQDMVRTVTDLSAKVERQEARNRNIASKFFMNKKNVAKSIRRGAGVVNAYAKNIYGSTGADPYFMDRKN